MDVVLLQLGRSSKPNSLKGSRPTSGANDKTYPEQLSNPASGSSVANFCRATEPTGPATLRCEQFAHISFRCMELEYTQIIILNVLIQFKVQGICQLCS